MSVFGEDVVAGRSYADWNLLGVLADVVLAVSVQVLNETLIGVVDVPGESDCEISLLFWCLHR